MPALEEAVREAAAAMAELQQRIAEVEQSIRVAETKRDSMNRVLAQIGERRQRLEKELQELAVPLTDPVREVEEQLAQETAELSAREAGLPSCATRAGAAGRAAGQRASRRSRRAARSPISKPVPGAGGAAGEDRPEQGQRRAGFSIARSPRRVISGKALDIEPGWEDALEAVLRERLERARARSPRPSLDWFAEGATPPGGWPCSRPRPAPRACHTCDGRHVVSEGALVASGDRAPAGGLAARRALQERSPRRR